MPNPQPADALFAVNGMNNQLKDARFQTAVTNTCATTVPLICQ